MNRVSIFLCVIFLLYVSFITAAHVSVDVTVGGEQHHNNHQHHHNKEHHHHEETPIEEEEEGSAEIDAASPLPDLLSSIVTPSTINTADLSFIMHSGDPFGSPKFMAQGKWKGALLNTKSARSIRILSPSEYSTHGIPANEVQSGDIVFANFYSENDFWIAHFPAGAAEKLFVQAEIFHVSFPQVGHTMARYVLNKPIKLYKQRPNQENPKVPMITDITFSNEALMALNKKTGESLEPYNPIGGGISKHYALVFRVVSTQQKWMESGKTEPLRQYELNIPKVQINAIITQALKLSNTNIDVTRNYNTFENSCASTFFVETLDPALKPYRTGFVKALENIAGKFARLNPAEAALYLKVRGIPYTRVADVDPKLLSGK